MEMIPNAEREKIYKERTKRVRVGILTTFVGHSDVGDKFMWVRDSSNIRHQQLSPISVKPFLGSHAYVFEYSSFRLKFKRNSLSPYIICCCVSKSTTDKRPFRSSFKRNLFCLYLYDLKRIPMKENIVNICRMIQ